MKIIKVKKKFEYEGIELRIVEREEPYMNGKNSMTMTRVLAPNGGMIPISLQCRQNSKSLVEATIKNLDNFKSLGCDVKAELLRTI